MKYFDIIPAPKSSLDLFMAWVNHQAAKRESLCGQRIEVQYVENIIVIKDGIPF